ncbi:hypothetical protein GCM10027194_16490 [Thalassiella azotivora]
MSTPAALAVPEKTRSPGRWVTRSGPGAVVELNGGPSVGGENGRRGAVGAGRAAPPDEPRSGGPP